WGALLMSGRPQQVLDQSSIVQELSTTRAEEMTQMRSAARLLSSTQQSARRVRTGILGLRSKLASQKKALGKLVARQQALLAQLTPAQQAAAGPGGPAAGGGTTYTGPTSTQAEKAVAFAYAQIGKPYVWGATGPGSYDCSGLMMAAWASAGVSIPRDTYGEWAGLPHLPVSQIQPGDLVMYDAEGHVAMYVGGGYLIDAPHSGAFVEKVSFSGWYGPQNAIGVLRP
ncbi:MAG: C40 family peptidase, partial [Actinomycetota bacterium]